MQLPSKDPDDYGPEGRRGEGSDSRALERFATGVGATGTAIVVVGDLLAGEMRVWTWLVVLCWGTLLVLEIRKRWRPSRQPD